jgi:protein-disulfide isomerase
MSHTRPRNTLPLLVISFALTVACSSASSGDPSPKPAAAPTGAVAVVDGQAISLSQLDEKAAAGLRQVRQQEYQVRQNALDQMIADQILDKEAKARGITKEALIQAEVTGKLGEPSEAEINQLWEANKDRVGGRTKEQLLPDIIQYLKNQKGQTAQQEFLKTLRAKYKVRVLLEPPRVEVSVDDDPVKGPAGAQVTIVEFSDYQCPFCGRVEDTLRQVMEKYKGRVRLVYRDYPLSIHPLAPKAAEAAHCANDQGKFWEYHDALYADQSKLTVPDLEATAQRLELKMEPFKTCLSSGKYAAEVSKDASDAEKAGVGSTPSFFINGIPLVGAQGLPAFEEVIDRELERIGK